jgi:protein-tyrosine phosphatase
LRTVPESPHLPADRVLVPAANLRDVGGVPTTDGRHVRRGRLYRSGYLSELDDQDLDAVRALGLRTIVDLRRPDEADLRPTPHLPGVTSVSISTSDHDNEFAVLAANLADPIVAANAGEYPRAYNRNIVLRSIDRFRPVFDLVMDPGNHPLLFHCTAGKDRTGFVAAVVLRLLGVDEDLIRADYVLTNEVRRAWIATRLDMFRHRLAEQHGIAPEAVTDEMLAPSRHVIEAASDAIQAALDAVPEVHGTWAAFRRDGLGIDDATFARFAGVMLD